MVTSIVTVLEPSSQIEVGVVFVIIALVGQLHLKFTPASVIGAQLFSSSNSMLVVMVSSIAVLTQVFPVVLVNVASALFTVGAPLPGVTSIVTTYSKGALCPFGQL